MGQKTHPIGFRLGISHGWQARWFAGNGAQYAKLVNEDIQIRKIIKDSYPDGGISKVEIDRDVKEVMITIKTSRIGVVLGRSGKRIDDLRARLSDLTDKQVRTNVLEVRVTELDATQMAQSIAHQIEARANYRRALRSSIQRTMQAGAKGIKITVSGRLGGAEIARSDTQLEGSVPLHTLDAKIDYAIVEANTTYGVIGIKVWIYPGDNAILDNVSERRRPNRSNRKEANNQDSESGSEKPQRQTDNATTT